MKFLLVFSLAAVLFLNIGCGGDGEKVSATPTKKPANPNGLTDFEMTHGTGPIKAKLELGPIDQLTAKKGEKVFELKCYQCHRIDSRLVGPPLHDVLKRRQPEYVLNMILNPEGMLKKHPEAKKMLAQYLTPMTFQNVSKDEAMMILEYLRSEYDKETRAAAAVK
ncbi:MAG: cytochrome c [Bacteroidetes bacterium]|nr:cytochrome c [Bacteroidota bacterium]